MIERFRRWLRGLLGVSEEELRILDSFPIPVATKSSRPGRGNGFDRAEGGYCASKKLSYLGFKLGMLITDHGIPDVYDLFSAKPHDLRLLEDLLGQAQQIIAFGDKGFICDPKREQLAEEQAVYRGAGQTLLLADDDAPAKQGRHVRRVTGVTLGEEQVRRGNL